MIKVFGAAVLTAGVLSVGVLASGLWAVGPLAAEENNESKHAVEYRQAVMAAIGGHTGSIARIARQQVPYDHILPHAEAIATTAPLVDDIWPDHSKPTDYERTDALESIWDERDEFQARIDRFKEAADDFAVAAGSGDMAEIMPAFQQLGESCSACHDDYRAE